MACWLIFLSLAFWGSGAVDASELETNCEAFVDGVGATSLLQAGSRLPASMKGGPGTLKSPQNPAVEERPNNRKIGSLLDSSGPSLSKKNDVFDATPLAVSPDITSTSAVAASPSDLYWAGGGQVAETQMDPPQKPQWLEVAEPAGLGTTFLAGAQTEPQITRPRPEALGVTASMSGNFSDTLQLAKEDMDDIESASHPPGVQLGALETHSSQHEPTWSKQSASRASDGIAAESDGTLQSRQIKSPTRVDDGRTSLEMLEEAAAAPIPVMLQRLSSEVHFEQAEESLRDVNMHLRQEQELLKMTLENAKLSRENAQLQFNLVHGVQSENDTNGSQVEYELAAGNATMTKSKVVLVLLEALGATAFLGVDRCYMGQYVLGVAKGVTFGGFGIWFLLDYVTIATNALQEKDSIKALGFEANFTTADNEVKIAKYTCIAGIFFKFCLYAVRWARSRPE